jgi:hypothetical protein
MDAIAVGVHVWRWNGTIWTMQSNGVQHDTEYDFGVFGFGPNDGWIVGQQAYLHHWDGSHWSEFDPNLSDPSLYSNTFYAVWGNSPGDVWVMGDGVASHFNGSVFTAIPAPTPHIMKTMWGFGSRDIWAGGEAGTLLHYQ